MFMLNCDDDREGAYRDGPLTDEERAACHERMRRDGTWPPDSPERESIASRIRALFGR